MTVIHCTACGSDISEEGKRCSICGLPIPNSEGGVAIRICPHPQVWHEVHRQLQLHASRGDCTPPKPPIPLILGGWVFSNDYQKRERWEETVEWARRNGCPLVVDLPDDSFYCVTELSTHDGGERSWNVERRPHTSAADLVIVFEKLRAQWPEVVGAELASITVPLTLTGRSGRRLLVQAKPESSPPWGTWETLSQDPAIRRNFTHFRAAINRAIAPHEVDHVDFVAETMRGDRVEHEVSDRATVRDFAKEPFDIVGLRLAAGLSVPEAADLLGQSTDVLANLERGALPISPAMLRKIRCAYQRRE